MNREMKQYILDHHKDMTVAEMVADSGFDKIQLKGMLLYLGLKAVGPADRVRAYIKENPESILEDVAEKFDRNPTQIYTYAKELGLRLKTRKSLQRRDNDWLGPEDNKESDRRLKELMRDPRVIEFLKENSFIIPMMDADIL